MKLQLSKRKWRVLGGGLLVVAAVVALGALYLVRHNHWVKAEDYYKTGQYQKVYDLVGNQPLPTDAKELSIYGQAMMATQHYDKALKAYQELNKQNSSLDTELILANIKQEMGDNAAAESQYQAIVNQNSGFIQAYLNLASLYRIEGQADKANEILLSGIKNNPQSASLYSYLISINADKKGAKDYQSWVDNLKKLDPGAQISS
ncbi:MAG TPA: hypothetical protein VMQ44_03385 [Candidatus Saccharimonadales bacterium]|nr:hypothetical protein [Candidatus Saccharimonadales bacterium]